MCSIWDRCSKQTVDSKRQNIRPEILCSPYGTDVENKRLIRKDKIYDPNFMWSIWDRCSKQTVDSKRQNIRPEILCSPYGTDIETNCFSKFIKCDLPITKNTNVN